MTGRIDRGNVVGAGIEPRPFDGPSVGRIAYRHRHLSAHGIRQSQRLKWRGATGPGDRKVDRSGVGVDAQGGR